MVESENVTSAVNTTLSALIASADGGDQAAVRTLFSALYAELHQMAKREVARSGRSGRLGATTLLHEAYLDISARDPAFPDRARFFAYAARVMRGIIVDNARRGRAQKRGGQFEITELDTNVAEQAVDAGELSRLSDAVEALAAADSSLAELVDLKFFCGFTFAEIAAMRGVSERTVQRDWEKARIYLHRLLNVAGS